MLQRSVTHPAALTAIAATIVLAAASVAAPLVAPRVYAVMELEALRLNLF